MGKPTGKGAPEKAAAVIAVLRGEISAIAAARAHGVSEQTIHNWKAAFLQGGEDRLAGRRATPTSTQPAPDEIALRRQIDELKDDLRDAQVQLRVYEQGARTLPPSPTSR